MLLFEEKKKEEEEEREKGKKAYKTQFWCSFPEFLKNWLNMWLHFHMVLNNDSYMWHWR